MNLREKLGQLLLYRLPFATGLTPKIAQLLVDCRAGGVVLFGYNIPSLESITRFTHDLQELAAKNGLPPFIISLDEEGGQVSRMPAGGQNLIAPSPMGLALAGPGAVRDCAIVTAYQLRRLGFNLNFAPSVDVNNNPANPVIGTRSFGEDPYRVAELASVAVRGYIEAGISPCAKHFPGHGDTSVDSHYGLPVVNKSLAELREFELIPFRGVIEAGVPAIMSAHIVYPQVDPTGLPATLSHQFLTGLLREELGFDGLIMTDALDMGAIADRYGLGQATLLSLQAGADVVLALSQAEDWVGAQRQAFEQVVAAVEGGALDLGLLDQKVARLEEWRKRFATPDALPAPSQHEYEIITESARHSLKVIRANPDYLPLSQIGARRPLLIDFTVEMASPVEEGRRPGPLLEQELQNSLPTLLRIEVAVTPSPAEIRRVHEWAGCSDLLIIVARNASQFKEQSTLLHDLLSEFKERVPLVVIAAREPYDLDLFADVPLAVLTYGDPPATMRALARFLSEPQPAIV